MFGDKLRKLREAHHLSQQQLAEKLGMSPSGIGMWEQNRRQPDNEMAKKNSSIIWCFYRLSIRKRCKS